MQALRGGDSGWRPLRGGDLVTEVSRILSIIIVNMTSSSCEAYPIGGQAPLDRCWLQMGNPQPHLLSILPCNDLAGPAAKPGVDAANNLTFTNHFGGAALPAADSSISFLWLVLG